MMLKMITIMTMSCFISAIIHMTLFGIMFYIYMKQKRPIEIFLSITMLGLALFSISAWYEELFGLNNLIFCIGTLAGITGVFFSLLFWESIRTENILNKTTAIGILLTGFSQSSLFLYSLMRPYWSFGRFISGILQLILYIYVFSIALHTLSEIRRFKRHKVIEIQLKLLSLIAIPAYGGVIIMLILSIPYLIHWHHVFLILSFTSIAIVTIYIKKPLLFFYLPQNLFELEDFKLERIMVITWDGKLIWSSSYVRTAKEDLLDKLLSNFVTMMDVFSTEVLNISPETSITTLRIDNKLIFIKRFQNFQCLIIANKMVAPLKKALQRFISRLTEEISLKELTEISEEIRNKINRVFKEEFAYILMMVRSESN